MNTIRYIVFMVLAYIQDKILANVYFNISYVALGLDYVTVALYKSTFATALNKKEDTVALYFYIGILYTVTKSR